MTQFSKYLLIFFAASFNYSLCYCQSWKKQKLQAGDTAFAIYSWESHSEVHSAFGEIVLTKNGRFKYSSHHPLNFNQYSEGDYVINKNVIFLISDFQTNNMKVEVRYVDTTTSDTSYTRLSFPINQKGDIFYHAYYYLNNDTSFESQFDPMLPFHRNLLDSIKSIMIKFYDMDCGSPWIPITSSDKFIKVKMLTDKNLENAELYKVIDWKFNIVGDKLIATSNNQ